MPDLTMAAPPKPWEGSDRPTPYTIVNTKDGKPTTVLPLTGWKGRGLSIGLTLYHGSHIVGNYVPERRGRWSHSYSSFLRGVSSGWALNEPNGEEKVFTGTTPPYNSAPYVETAGFFDTLAVSHELSSPRLEYTVTRRSGVRCIYSTDISQGPPERPAAKEKPAAPMAPPGNPEAGTILRLRRIVDRNGNEINLTYGPDGDGYLSSVTDPTGRSLTFTYIGNTTVITDPMGQTWTLNYNSSASTLDSIVNAAPGETSRAFSFSYLGMTYITALADWKTNAEHPGQNTWTFTHNYGTDRLTQVDGPTWLAAARRPQKAYIHGANGGADTRVQTKTGIGTYSTVAHTYGNADGDLTKVTTWNGTTPDPGGNDPFTELLYDSYAYPHQPYRVNKSSGGGTDLYYDGNGNVTYANSAGTADIVIYSDPLNPNLPTQTSDTQSRVTTYKYDANGNLTDVWDANHPVSDTAPDLSKLHTHYAIDSHGRVTGVSNFSVSGSMPKAWTYIYDDMNSHGNLTGVQRPGSSAPAQTFGYDGLSRRVWSRRSPTDPKTNYRYDGFGRLTGIDYGDNGTWDITYAFDANGGLIHMEDETGVPTDWDRDALNRVTAEYKNKGTGTQTAAHWTYNADGGRDVFTNWNGEAATHAYHTNGQLQSVSGPWGTGQAVSFHYLCACGQPESVDYPSLHIEDRGDGEGGYHGRIYYEKNPDPNHVYNPSNDPQVFWEKVHTPPADLTHENTRHVSVIESSGPDSLSRVQFFTPDHESANPDSLYRTSTDRMSYYDGANVMNEGASIYNNLYQFDGAPNSQENPGNRIAATKDGSSWTYQYDANGLNRLGYVRKAGVVMDGFTYDAEGNVSTAGRYDAPGFGQHAFSYTGGNLLSRITDSGTYGSGIAAFVYDGLGRLAQKKDGAGNLLESYYYAGNQRTFQTEANGDSVSYQWAGGRLLAQKQTIGGTTTTAWYILDVLGNVRALVDDQNNLLAQYIYDAFGNEQPGTFDNLTIQNPFRYRGSLGYSRVYGGYEGTTLQERGGYTLYNAGARTYHTGIGRWLQEDPIIGIPSDPLSFNRFLYCNASPVDNSDPLGLTPLIPTYGFDPPCYGFSECYRDQALAPHPLWPPTPGDIASFILNGMQIVGILPVSPDPVDLDAFFHCLGVQMGDTLDMFNGAFQDATREFDRQMQNSLCPTCLWG